MSIFGRSVKLNIDGKLITRLRVVFSVTRDLKPDPNEAVIQVYNLNADSRAKLTVPKPVIPVQLEAGYREATSTVFLGNVRRVDSIRNGADWITRLRSGDGTDKTAQNRVSLSLTQNADPGTILEKLAAATGLAFGNAREVAAKGDAKGALTTFAKGFTAHGNAFDELVRAAAQLGYDASVQNGELLLLAIDQCSKLPAVLLTPTTGLKGSPETGEKGTVKATSSLNAGIIPGRAVKIESDTFDGFFRVEAVTHTGDTHGNVWDSDMTLRAIQTTVSVEVGPPVIGAFEPNTGSE